jgi:hypothetical protein
MIEFALGLGGAGFEPGTTVLQSGAHPWSHLSSKIILFRIILEELVNLRIVCSPLNRL